MQEYENMIEALVGMAKITRPKINIQDSAAVQRHKNIQHGICDLLEDAAVAIDELLKRIPNEDRTCHEESLSAA